VELKPPQAAALPEARLWFESNQSGIETTFLYTVDKLFVLFESNQSGIETTRNDRRSWAVLVFESNQSGIETVFKREVLVR